MSDPDPIVQNSNFEYILRGMSKMPGRRPIASYNFLVKFYFSNLNTKSLVYLIKIECSIVIQISNFIFHNWIPPINDQDLLSTDMQRGRDNGVMLYVQARKFCGFPEVSSYEDLRGVWSDNVLFTLQYNNSSTYFIIIDKKIFKIRKDDFFEIIIYN